MKKQTVTEVLKDWMKRVGLKKGDPVQVLADEDIIVFRKVQLFGTFSYEYATKKDWNTIAPKYRTKKRLAEMLTPSKKRRVSKKK